jgi:TonB-linked SusC/RagA family outer membrane protein
MRRNLLKKFVFLLRSKLTLGKYLAILTFAFILSGTDAKAFQEDIKVSGVVKDKIGPLPGVTVYLKSNPALGTTTNVDGKYTLKVPANGTLVFTFIGYVKQDIDIRGEGVINVELSASDNKLDEVVIVAYGEQKKESIVGAVSTISIKDLKTPTRSLHNTMAGRVAGVIAVQRSGEPGNDDAQFWIRGISTFGAGSSPLILVDGVERPMNNIEPEDIESFSILKDASAVAVYGIRGANGVVLVSTRRGSNEKPVLSLKIETGVNASTKLPQMADAATVYELYNEANLNSNPNFNTQYNPEIIQKYRDQSDPELYPNVDWIGLMMKDYTDNQRVNLNVSGGSDVAKYYVSTTYYSENGIWKGDNFNAYNTNAKLQRYNFRANTDIKLNKNTSLGLGLGGILVSQNYPGRSSDAIWDMIMRTNPGDYLPTYPNPDGSGVVFGGFGQEAIRNPYADLVATGFQTTWNNNVQSDVTLKHELSWVTKGLVAKGKFAFDANNTHNIQRTRNLPDMYRAVGRDANGVIKLNRYYDGQEDLNFGKQSGGDRRIYMQLDLNYDRTFGNHRMGALMLYNQQDYVNANAGSSIYALPFRYQGLVSKLSYSYKGKYFMEASSGYNGSENFQKGHRFGFFPAVGAGWIVSEEPFFKDNISFVEFLKFRGSYGYKGNDQIGGRRFAYLTTVGGGHGGWSFGVDGANGYGGKGEDEIGADLTWEKEKEINLGFETRFLKGFYLQADIFKRERTGIFMQRSSLPQILGLIKAPWANIGAMENKGVDASLEYKRNVNKLNLTFRGNFTFARNKIIENDQPDYLYPYLSSKGKRFGQPFGLNAERLYTDADFSDLTNFTLSPGMPLPKFGNRVKPGDIKYTDINGDGALDLNDRIAIGNPGNPEIVYGFGSSANFKGFDLSAFFQGTGNMDFMLGGPGVYPFYEQLGRTGIQTFITDRWTAENPRQDALFPRLSYGENPNNFQPSTWWQKDASYLRLKSVEFGYTFDKGLITKLKMTSLRMYVTGFNLVTWSKFKLWDPELGAGNGARYPIQRNVSFGLNVNL